MEGNSFSLSSTNFLNGLRITLYFRIGYFNRKFEFYGTLIVVMKMMSFNDVIVIRFVAMVILVVSRLFCVV